VALRVSEFTASLAELASRRRPFAIATVTKTEGSTLAKRGFRIVVSKDGEVVGGTLGGGCPEGPIVEVALRAMGDGQPRLVRVHLVDADRAVAGTARNPSEDEIFVETYCGGTLEVFIDPMLPPERLVLVGQGGKDDVEEALIRMGKELGFDVVVVDPVPNLREKPDVLVKSATLDPKALQLQEQDSVVVLTKGERDVGLLEALSRANCRFVGILASRQRLQKDLEELRERGVPEKFIQGLHAPVGLDIGAKTPSELALSIMADVVATKYGRDIPHKPFKE
jgi:xanthine dehydrogenase accessory factor